MSQSLPPSAFDKEGFLRQLSDWDTTVAAQIASAEHIALTPEHWAVIELLRRYYQEYEASPAMRAFVKYCAIHLGPDRGKSLYLLTLFPESPAKIASKIAGLPKPDNCL